MSKSSKREVRDDDEGRKVKNSLRHSTSDRKRIREDNVFIDEDSEMSKYEDELNYFIKKSR